MAKSSLAWVSLAGNLYATGSLNGQAVKLTIRPSHPSNPTYRESELYTIDGAGQHYIGRCLGYIVGHKDLDLEHAKKYNHKTSEEAEAEVKALAEYLFNS